MAKIWSNGAVENHECGRPFIKVGGPQDKGGPEIKKIVQI